MQTPRLRPAAVTSTRTVRENIVCVRFPLGRMGGSALGRRREHSEANPLPFDTSGIRKTQILAAVYPSGPILTVSSTAPAVAINKFT